MPATGNCRGKRWATTSCSLCRETETFPGPDFPEHPVAARLQPAATTINKKRRDRKSTRLNSSHLVISYAVFCLKKKNKRNCTRPCATQTNQALLLSHSLRVPRGSLSAIRSPPNSSPSTKIYPPQLISTASCMLL